MFETINKSFVVSEDDPDEAISAVTVARRKDSAISLQTINSHPTIREEKEEKEEKEVDASVDEFKENSRERFLNHLKAIGIILFFFSLFSIHVTLCIIKIMHLGEEYLIGLQRHEIFLIIVELIAIAGLVWLILKSSILRESNDELEQSSQQGGLNLLFRIGVIIFFIGRTISQLFDLLTYQESQHLSNNDCVLNTPFLYPLTILSILMDIMETYLVFKYHSRTFTVKRYIVRLILGLLIIFDIMTYVEEIVKGAMLFHERAAPNLVQSSLNNTLDRNYLLPKNCTGSFLASYEMAAPYLFLFDVTFSFLIIGALIQLMVETWGPLNDNFLFRTADHTGPSSVRCMATDNIYSSSKPCDVNKRYRYPSTFFTKAHTGLFLSLFLLAVWVVLAVFSLLVRNENKNGEFCYNFIRDAVDIFIFVIGIIFSVYLFVRVTIKFRYYVCHSGIVHIFLMYLTTFGSTLLSILMIVADVRNLMYGYIDIDDSIMYLANDLIEFFQILIQTIFILASYNLRASSKRERHWKPGKGALLFLSCLNIALWLDKTISFMLVVTNLPSLYTYGIDIWSIIEGAFKPLFIFYRFLSATLLVEMMSSLYYD